MAGVGRRFLASVLITWFAAALMSCGGDDAGSCDADAIRASLAAAAPGDVVRVGACRVQGPFVVPAGVELRGMIELSVLDAPPDGVAVELVGDGAILRRVLVAATGRAGVVARASVSIGDVRIHVTRGIGIGVTEDASLLAAFVRVEGPIDSTNFDDPSFTRVLSSPIAAAPCPVGVTCECTPGDVEAERACDGEGRWATLAGTHGIVVRGGSLRGEGVDVHGLAEVGVLLVSGASAELFDLNMTHVLGVGVLARDSTLRLEDSAIASMHEGLRGRPSYAVLSGQSAVTSTRLALTDNDRFGLVAVGGSAAHSGLSAQGTGDVTVWAAGVDSLRLAADDVGTATQIDDGAFAAVVVTDSSHVSISDLQVVGVRSSRRPVGLIGAVEIGDGLHFIRTYEDVSLSRVDVRGAARAGLTLELSAGAAAPLFTEVAIDATGSALGAVAGAPEAGTDTLRVGAAPAGWDSGITRSGAALANDAAFTGTLDAVLSAMPPRADEVLGVVAPMY